jgi:hypothetical protein
MPGYLLVVVNGEWTTENIKQKLDEVKCEADDRKTHRLFLDLRLLKMPVYEFTRFQSAEYLARVFIPPFKIASLMLPENITLFAENVAVNRGANLKVFSDERQAIGWLIEGPGKDFDSDKK